VEREGYSGDDKGGGGGCEVALYLKIVYRFFGKAFEFKSGEWR
jgi:hypothetical protein